MDCNEKHNHKDNEECGCGDDCKCNDNHHETKDIIYLTLDNREELKCQVLEILRVEDKEYIVLLPEGEDKVYIYGYKEVEGDPKLSIIEEDDEFNKVAEVYNNV